MTAIEEVALCDGHVGALVIYREQIGSIHRWNDRYVFVRYFGNLNPVATRGEDLEWFDRREAVAEAS